MRRTSAIVLVTVMFLVIIVGMGRFFTYSNLAAPGSQPSGNQLQETQINTYVPIMPASSTPVVVGSCFTNSIAAPYRSDAWRCSVGNAISDPCFEIPNSKNLFCGADPAAPAATSSFVLKLTKSLPASEVPSSTVPSNWAWLVVLSDGTLCTPFTGTRPFAAGGEVALYACNGGVGEEMIFGDLHNAGAVWTAMVGSLSRSTSTFPPVIESSSTVSVSAVWQ